MTPISVTGFNWDVVVENTALGPLTGYAAELNPGDTLDVHFYKGTIVLRKRQPLTPEQCAALLERSRSQPKSTAEDEAATEQAIREARAPRR